MTIAISVRFLVGRYHATPWDSSVNDGLVEWPPSPWRMLRALVSTWHERSTVPAAAFDSALERLPSVSPSVWCVDSQRGHSRHYMPDTKHTVAETGNTDKVLDAFVRMPLGQAANGLPHLVMVWGVDVDAAGLSALREVVERVPYLGRSESVCEMAIAEEVPEILEAGVWWRPRGEAAKGDRTRVVRRLEPVSEGFSRAVLESTPTALRRAGRPQTPPGTRWTTYAQNERTEAVDESAEAEVASQPAQAVRWSLHSSAPFMARYGVLATETLRRAALSKLPDPVPADIVGKLEDEKLTGKHRHAHWLWLPRPGTQTQPREDITDLVLWMGGDDISGEVVDGLSAVRDLWASNYEPRGFRESRLVMQSAGRARDVIPSLVASRGSRSWRSVTPFLVDRHRKRETVEDFVGNLVDRHLAYRGLPPLAGVTLLPDHEEWVRQHRRYRWADRMDAANAGYALQIELAEPTVGPLVLGHLAHFGFGVFRPAAEHVS